MTQENGDIGEHKFIVKGVKISWSDWVVVSER